MANAVSGKDFLILAEIPDDNDVDCDQFHSQGYLWMKSTAARCTIGATSDDRDEMSAGAVRSRIRSRTAAGAAPPSTSSTGYTATTTSTRGK
ncbi:hypothetical protein BV898_13352 [Hypsibius exemplaris]|nr:hypothetical protein BV898_13352 [Hypsibius exemplaris]